MRGHVQALAEGGDEHGCAERGQEVVQLREGGGLGDGDAGERGLQEGHPGVEGVRGEGLDGDAGVGVGVEEGVV